MPLSYRRKPGPQGGGRPRILPAAWPGTDHISAAGVPTALSAPVLKAAPPPGAPFSDHTGQDGALQGRPHLQSPPSAFPLLVAIRCCQPASWSEVFPVDSSVSVCDQFVFHSVFVSHLWLFPGRSPSFVIELRTQTIFAELPGRRPRAILLVRAGPREPASVGESDLSGACSTSGSEAKRAHAQVLSCEQS